MLPLLFFLLLGEVALILQMALPDLYPALDHKIGALLPAGGEPQLVILVLVGAAMSLGDWRALVVAVVLGFHYDLLTPNRVGVTILCFSLITGLLLSQARTALARHLLYQILLVMVATFLYQALSYILVSLQLWRWRLPLNVWTILVVSSLLSAALYAVIGLGVRLLRRPGRDSGSPSTSPTPAYANRS